MALLVTFLLGIANFIIHKTVVDSDHPLLQSMGRFFHLLGGTGALAVEFAILLGVLLMVAQGHTVWAMFYGGYTVVNLGAAWLILSGMI